MSLSDEIRARHQKGWCPWCRLFDCDAIRAAEELDRQAKELFQLRCAMGDLDPRQLYEIDVRLVREGKE